MHSNNTISTYIYEAIIQNWDNEAFKEYPGNSFHYSQVAADILELHSQWESMGLIKGDKIAIYANNCAHWLEVYMAALVGGYIAILIPSNIQNDYSITILEHSGAKLLYTDKKNITCSHCYNILGIADIDSFNILWSNTLSKTHYFCNQIIQKNDLRFCNLSESDICTIVYTSGSTGVPKGSMLSIKNITYLFTNLFNCKISFRGQKHHVNLLPFYHVFGLLSDALPPFCFGVQLVILRCPPTPITICSLLQQYKPVCIVTVPFIFKSIIDFLLKDYDEYFLQEKGDNIICDANILHAMRNIVLNGLGGNVKLILAAGASTSPNFEKFLISQLHVPFTTGYGLSECGPIASGLFGKYIDKSCGRVINKHSFRLDSKDWQNEPGEIQVAGDGVFAGYYCAADLTSKVITSDGWFKTGDIGYIDKDWNLFITGRCKEMILTSNGENIYPDRIERIINDSPYISESILIQRGEKLHAIVVPYREKARTDGLDAEALGKEIDKVVREAGQKLPGFAIINSFELRDEPLERTPKGSLKRYLYSEERKEK